MQIRVIEKQELILKSVEKARGGRRSRVTKADTVSEKVDAPEDSIASLDTNESLQSGDTAESPAKRRRTVVETKQSSRGRKKKVRGTSLSLDSETISSSGQVEKVATPVKAVGRGRKSLPSNPPSGRAPGRPRRIPVEPTTMVVEEKEEIVVPVIKSSGRSRKSTSTSDEIAASECAGSTPPFTKSNNRARKQVIEEKIEPVVTPNRTPGRPGRKPKSGKKRGRKPQVREDRMPELEPEVAPEARRRNSLGPVAVAPALSPAHPGLNVISPAANPSPSTARLRDSSGPTSPLLVSATTKTRGGRSPSPTPTRRLSRSRSRPKSPKSSKRRERSPAVKRARSPSRKRSESPMPTLRRSRPKSPNLSNQIEASPTAKRRRSQSSSRPSSPAAEVRHGPGQSLSHAPSLETSRSPRQMESAEPSNEVAPSPKVEASCDLSQCSSPRESPKPSGDSGSRPITPSSSSNHSRLRSPCPSSEPAPDLTLAAESTPVDGTVEEDPPSLVASSLSPPVVKPATTSTDENCDNNKDVAEESNRGNENGGDEVVVALTPPTPVLPPPSPFLTDSSLLDESRDVKGGLAVKSDENRAEMAVSQGNQERETGTAVSQQYGCLPEPQQLSENVPTHPQGNPKDREPSADAKPACALNTSQKQGMEPVMSPASTITCPPQPQNQNNVNQEEFRGNAVSNQVSGPYPIMHHDPRQQYDDLIASVKDKTERLKHFERIREEIERKEKEQSVKCQSPLLAAAQSQLQPRVLEMETQNRRGPTPMHTERDMRNAVPASRTDISAQSPFAHEMPYREVPPSSSNGPNSHHMEERRVRTPAATMMEDSVQSQAGQNAQAMARPPCMREEMQTIGSRYMPMENQPERTYQNQARVHKEEVPTPRDPTPDREKTDVVEWGDAKRTPPTPGPDIPSMGVYTPDSTTNSVHSLHGYGPCDLDVSQLGLESPTSIGSADMTERATFECPQMMAGSPQHMQQYMQHLHHGAKSKHRSRAAHAHKPQLSPQQRGPSPQQRRAPSPLQQVIAFSILDF